MSLEEVLSGRDSEDEIDEEIMDLEDRRVCILSTVLYIVFMVRRSLLVFKRQVMLESAKACRI
jgi:hypothetical protein